MNYYESIVTTIKKLEFIECDRCKKKLDVRSDCLEAQEALHINYRAGYSSIFGDMNQVQGDFCQECVKELLGPYLRITENDGAL